jgi:hypothetical protein
VYRTWTVHRQHIPCRDGERRWDRAYELLVRWAWRNACHAALGNVRPVDVAVDRCRPEMISVTGGSGRARLDHLDAEVTGSVAQQVLEVLIASRFSEGRAGEKVLDPGATQVEGEEGVQLVPRP